MKMGRVGKCTKCSHTDLWGPITSAAPEVIDSKISQAVQPLDIDIDMMLVLTPSIDVSGRPAPSSLGPNKLEELTTLDQRAALSFIPASRFGQH